MLNHNPKYHEGLRNEEKKNVKIVTFYNYTKYHNNSVVHLGNIYITI